jgi:hypothetical protein
MTSTLAARPGVVWVYVEDISGSRFDQPPAEHRLSLIINVSHLSGIEIPPASQYPIDLVDLHMRSGLVLKSRSHQGPQQWQKLISNCAALVPHPSSIGDEWHTVPLPDGRLHLINMRQVEYLKLDEERPNPSAPYNLVGVTIGVGSPGFSYTSSDGPALQLWKSFIQAHQVDLSSI